VLGPLKGVNMCRRGGRVGAWAGGRVGGREYIMQRESGGVEGDGGRADSGPRQPSPSGSLRNSRTLPRGGVAFLSRAPGEPVGRKFEGQFCRCFIAYLGRRELDHPPLKPDQGCLSNSQGRGRPASANFHSTVRESSES
jgi:hypothetical protein